MKKSSNIITIVFAVVLFYTICSCGGAGVNEPGTEYMPDMGHSIAYEANYYDYYSSNRWGSPEAYYEMAKPRKPVKGTIPRGYAGEAASDNPNAIVISPNGSVPYYYDDTEEERTRAMTEITTNPFPITAAGLASAKPLYEINCGICHGNKGDGIGWLVDEKNKSAVYPNQPAILTNDEFTAASEGRLYHAIMYGKNVMGGYADKLSFEERWQVIHYIRSLQAKDRKLAYNETANTLNSVGIPGASVPKKKNKKAMKIAVPMLANTHGHDEHHGDSHGGQEEHHKEGDHDDANTHGHDHDAEHHSDGHDHHEGEHDGHDHDDHDHKDDHH